MGKNFTSAEDRVDEDDFESILTVLSGKSPWQDAIVAALKETRKNIPRRPFRILPQDDYKVKLHELDPKATPGNTPGVTDKQEGIILMQGYFGTKSREAMLGLSLHETVHLVSHRPGRAGRPHSTAFPILGEGLLEGLVELVTTDILNGQTITLADPKRRAHQKRVPVMEELIRALNLGIPLLAGLLFGGRFAVFSEMMIKTFTGPGWIRIQRLTTADDTAGAIRCITQLRAAEEARNRQRLEELRRQVPSPTSSQQSRSERPFVWRRGMSPPPPVRD